MPRDKGFPWVPLFQPWALQSLAQSHVKAGSEWFAPWCPSGFIPARWPLHQCPGAAPAFLEKITADLSSILRGLGGS